MMRCLFRYVAFVQRWGRQPECSASLLRTGDACGRNRMRAVRTLRECAECGHLRGRNRGECGGGRLDPDSRRMHPVGPQALYGKGDEDAGRRDRHRLSRRGRKVGGRIRRFRRAAGRGQRPQVQARNRRMPSGPSANRRASAGQPNRRMPAGQPNRRMPAGQPNRRMPAGQPNRRMPAGQPNRRMPAAQPSPGMSAGQEVPEATGWPPPRATAPAQARLRVMRGCPGGAGGARIAVYALVVIMAAGLGAAATVGLNGGQAAHHRRLLPSGSRTAERRGQHQRGLAEQGVGRRQGRARGGGHRRGH